jgi:hypothetical protein
MLHFVKKFHHIDVLSKSLEQFTICWYHATAVCEMSYIGKFNGFLTVHHSVDLNLSPT